MAFVEREGYGSLFRNQTGGVGGQPDYRGTFTLNGHQYEIAGWVKTSSKGTKFFSLKVGEPYKRPESQNAPAPADDDIPF